jgi:hypothetical protein
MESKQFKHRKKQKIRAGRCVLKKIEIGALAEQHALGIRPKEHLIVALQHGDMEKNEEVNVQVGRNANQHQNSEAPCLPPGSQGQMHISLFRGRCMLCSYGHCLVPRSFAW